MKKKPTDIMDMATKNSVSDAVKMAAANFMILSVSIGDWKGKKFLIEASEVAVKAAGALKGEVQVPLLGDHHEKLMAVVSAHSKVRTIFDKLAQPYIKGKPEKLCFVTLVPDVLAALEDQAKIASDKLQAFVPMYEQYIEEAMPSHGRWASEVRRLLPSKEELEQKFYVRIDVPKPVPAMDMAMYGCVPTDTLGKIVTASNEALALKFEAVKSRTIDDALKAVQTVVTQLSKDQPRMHQSVIEKARIASSQLRHMCDGYDGDTRLADIADIIDSEVLNVDDASKWADSMTKKWGARDAAEKTVKNLKRMKTAAPVADVPAADTLLAGGMLADIL